MLYKYILVYYCPKSKLFSYFRHTIPIKKILPLLNQYAFEITTFLFACVLF